MKTIIISLFVALNVQIIFAQFTSNFKECGERHTENYITEWDAIDTIYYRPEKECNWAYSEWGVRYSYLTLEIHYPCEPKTTELVQYRICEKGIKQARYKVIKIWYDPLPLTEYERILKELENLKYENWFKDTSQVTFICDSLFIDLDSLIFMQSDTLFYY